MEFHDMAHDREAEPEAAMPSRSLVLSEAIEDVREKLRADALAGIADREASVRARPFQTEVDAPSVRGELDRICEEVPDYLLQAGRVPCEQPGRWIEHGFEADILRVSETLNGLDRRLDDGDEVNGADLKPELAGHDPGYVQEVVNELGQELRVPLDHREGAGGRGLVQHAGRE